MNLLCSVCMRIGLLPANVKPAVTIANGHAVCGQHFQRLNGWETSDHGTPSLVRLVGVMYAPGPAPENPPAIGDVAKPDVHVNDRLTRDIEPLYGHEAVGTIDEIVLTDARVHIGRLDRADWMVIVENERAHFHLVARVGSVTEYELRADGCALGPTDEWSVS